MRKIYCPTCGSKMEFVAQKPNFCMNCGHAFAGAPEKPKPPPEPVDEEDDYYDEEVSDFGALRGLDVEVEAERDQGVKFGEVIGTALEGEEPFQRDPDPSVTSNEFLQNFSKEAGSIRGPKPEFPKASKGAPKKAKAPRKPRARKKPKE
tara:strand:+ start:681 stop:1127 length:447 start_codon:yes stop_codon:yes gene_type:complete